MPSIPKCVGFSGKSYYEPYFFDSIHFKCKKLFVSKKLFWTLVAQNYTVKKEL